MHATRHRKSSHSFRVISEDELYFELSIKLKATQPEPFQASSFATKAVKRSSSCTFFKFDQPFFVK